METASSRDDLDRERWNGRCRPEGDLYAVETRQVDRQLRYGPRPELPVRAMAEGAATAINDTVRKQIKDLHGLG